MLTVGSLFSGIGGIDLGLERAGMKVLWQVEIDPWCRAVLAKHWPDVERFEDVRNVGAGNLAPVDLIAGGFPCQDISEAGKRIGISGSRSGLWSEYARIIRELRPRYVFVENVVALTRRGLDVVLGDLALLGYDAEWDRVGACALGATMHRERLWVLANAHNSGLQGPIWAGQSAAPGEERAAACGESLRSVGGFWPSGPGAVANIPRMADGSTYRVDRLRGLGNAVVPQVVEWIGRRIVEADKAQAEIAS